MGNFRHTNNNLLESTLDSFYLVEKVYNLICFHQHGKNGPMQGPCASDTCSDFVHGSKIPNGISRDYGSVSLWALNYRITAHWCTLTAF